MQYVVPDSYLLKSQISVWNRRKCVIFDKTLLFFLHTFIFEAFNQQSSASTKITNAKFIMNNR